MSEKLYNLAHAEDADMAVCDFYYVWETGQKHFSAIKNWQDDGGVSYREQILEAKHRPQVWIRIIRRSIYDQISDKYYPAANNMEDNVLTFLTAYYSRKFCYLPEPLFYHWGNVNSITGAGDNTPQKLLHAACERQRNVQVIENFISDIESIDKYYICLVRFKSAARNVLLRSKPSIRCWWKWLTMYPDLNRAMLFGNKHVKATKRSRLWFLSIAMGIYPLLRKHLFSRKYRPASYWSSCANPTAFTNPNRLPQK